MGLFSIFKDKKNDKKDEKSKKKSESDRIIDSFFETVQKNEEHKEFLDDSLKFKNIHKDLDGLLWFADGSRKNYTFKRERIVSSDGNEIFSRPEPSAIYLSERICVVDDYFSVKKMSHYPSYIPIDMTSPGMTEEQKYAYMKFVENPYDNRFDIGFVFVLFYGLERFMLNNSQLDRCVNVIIKLREIFDNRSFLMYSVFSTVYLCIYNKREDLLHYFIENDKKWEENSTDFNTFLLLLYKSNKKFLAKHLVAFYKEIGFKKDNYIKGYPEIFMNELENLICKEYPDGLYLSSMIKDDTLLDSIKVPILCNYCLNMDARLDMAIKDYSSFSSIIGPLYNLLNNAHENVKAYLKEKKEEGIELEKTLPSKKIKEEQLINYEEIDLSGYNPFDLNKIPIVNMNKERGYLSQKDYLALISNYSSEFTNKYEYKAFLIQKEIYEKFNDFEKKVIKYKLDNEDNRYGYELTLGRVWFPSSEGRDFVAERVGFFLNLLLPECKDSALKYFEEAIKLTNANEYHEASFYYGFINKIYNKDVDDETLKLCGDLAIRASKKKDVWFDYEHKYSLIVIDCNWVTSCNILKKLGMYDDAISIAQFAVDHIDEVYGSGWEERLNKLIIAKEKIKRG